MSVRLPAATPKLAVCPEEAAALMSVAERTVWTEIASGRLRSFTLGRRRLIRVVDIEAFLERRALLAGDGPTTRRQSPAKVADGGVMVPFPELERAR